jgi:hypothetical protein
MLETGWFLVLALPCVASQIQTLDSEMRCPQHWVRFQLSCYRFIKSPLRNRNDARKNCEVGSEELSCSSFHVVAHFRTVLNQFLYTVQC